MDGRPGASLFRLPTMVPRQRPQPPYWWGLGLITSGILLLAAFLYTAVISKLLPPSGRGVLDAVRSDWYYALLIPLTIPTMMVTVYLHWLSMKLFQHA